MTAWIDNTQRLPHLLLYGPPGTGKTSLILAAARKLGITPLEVFLRAGAERVPVQSCRSPSLPPPLVQLNASDDRKVEVVRDRIVSYARGKSLFGFSHSLGTESARHPLYLSPAT